MTHSEDIKRANRYIETHEKLAMTEENFNFLNASVTALRDEVDNLKKRIMYLEAIIEVEILNNE